MKYLLSARSYPKLSNLHDHCPKEKEQPDCENSEDTERGVSQVRRPEGHDRAARSEQVCKGYIRIPALRLGALAAILPYGRNNPYQTHQGHHAHNVVDVRGIGGESASKQGRIWNYIGCFGERSTQSIRMHILQYKPCWLLGAALSFSLVSAGCASLGTGWRLAIGTSSGAAVGAGAGALLSPNDASRPLNALVFGLAGALGGGLVAYLTDPTPSQPRGETLKQKELGDQAEASRFSVGASDELPAYVKERLAPVVIEEAVERDAVGEDGSLHEPHKVYRIVRPAELTPKPNTLPVRAK